MGVGVVPPPPPSHPEHVTETTGVAGTVHTWLGTRGRVTWGLGLVVIGGLVMGTGIQI